MVSTDIEVEFGSGKLDLQRESVLDWIRDGATAVAAFYGAFPVPRARVLVMPVSGRRGIVQGTTWGGQVPFTRMRLGKQTTQDDLHTDWEMTHEFVHMAFPSVAEKNHWIEEGLATYVEPLARARIGLIRPAEVWNDMLRDMPKGEPEQGDRGLDRTHTWARTYWGGALFCLMADVEMRERSANRTGLIDALRAIVCDGGTIQTEWPLSRALKIGDAATGSSVLTDLYAEMGNRGVPVDLESIWVKLGVKHDHAHVVFDDHAPLAAARQQIVSSPPA